MVSPPASAQKPPPPLARAAPIVPILDQVQHFLQKKTGLWEVSAILKELDNKSILPDRLLVAAAGNARFLVKGTQIGLQANAANGTSTPCDTDISSVSSAQSAAVTAPTPAPVGPSYLEIVAKPNRAPPAHCASLKDYFDSDRSQYNEEHGCALAGEVKLLSFKESSLLGRQLDGGSRVYLNTHEPFCIATIGVQGGGKSHTLNTILEACLIPFPQENAIRLDQPMTALVLHYDQSPSSMCEPTGLIQPHPSMSALLGSAAPHVARSDMVVLVSPSYYLQRKRFYHGVCEVQPLLFNWNSLTGDHIRKLMCLKQTDTQLYASSMLTLLMDYSRADIIPAFEDFCKEVLKLCDIQGQGAALKQRLNILESFIAESPKNKDIKDLGRDLKAVCGPGKLVIVDLTDINLTKVAANGIFQVLIEQFRTIRLQGKVLALDEAHRYIDEQGEDGLTQAIVEIARLMRHDGMRLIISTQSPFVLAPELLELVTTVVMHRFHSADWFEYLKAKLSLDGWSMQDILALHPGQALVFASRHLLTAANGNAIKLKIRPRITADRGASQTNI